MIRAVFLDVDGTLLSHTTEQVPASAREAVRLLREKGIQVFLATGRHAQEVALSPVVQLDFDGWVTLNGQLSLNARGEVLAATAMDSRDVDTLVKLFREKRLPLMIVEKDRMYFNFDSAAGRAGRALVALPMPPVGEYAGAPVYQFTLFCPPEEARPIASRLVASRFTWWTSLAADIIPSVGGKAAGIRGVLEARGIRREEAMAFGDGDNDRDMLRYAGIGVAMGNADLETQRCADYVTSSVDEDGVRRALEHFGVL